MNEMVDRFRFAFRVSSAGWSVVIDGHCHGSAMTIDFDAEMVSGLEAMGEMMCWIY